MQITYLKISMKHLLNFTSVGLNQGLHEEECITDLIVINKCCYNFSQEDFSGTKIGGSQ
jgi:hypothetical protein